MAEQMDKNLADGKRIVKEATGVEPESIGYRWAWGDVATFLPSLVRFKKEDWDKVDEKVMRRDRQPLKPRGEVYTREFTEAGWKSYSELHGL